MSAEVIFDIETQNTFAQVDNNIKKIRLSVVSIYDYKTDSYQSFTEDELKQLWPILEKAERLIGYNSEHFDLPILNNYYPGDLLSFPNLDLIKVVYYSLGKRPKLNDLAEATLDNIIKTADGLQAIKWWQQGEVEKIKEYCEQDVRITKQLYEFGRQHKQLFYKTLAGEILPFAVNFADTVPMSKINNKPGINLTLPI